MAMAIDDAKMMESCAETCHVCQDACLKTLVHALQLGGEHAGREHQTILTDCAAICGVSHNLLHRQSAQHVHTCGACAAICTACAEACERMAEGEGPTAECARACRRCAESCRAMTAG